MATLWAFWASYFQLPFRKSTCAPQLQYQQRSAQVDIDHWYHWDQHAMWIALQYRQSFEHMSRLNKNQTARLEMPDQWGDQWSWTSTTHIPQSNHTLMESMKLGRLLVTNISNLFVSILSRKTYASNIITLTLCVYCSQNKTTPQMMDALFSQSITLQIEFENLESFLCLCFL